MMHDWKKTKRYRDVVFDFTTMEFELVFHYVGDYLHKRKKNKKSPTTIAFLKGKK